MKSIVAVGFILSLSILAACAGSIPVPAEHHDRWAALAWPGTTHADLIEGRRLYIENCSGCHGLKSPMDYTENQWKENVSEMRQRAKIKEADSQLILKYLITAAQKSDRLDTAAMTN
jgi:cytochrome c1